ncbi:MAG: SGNH/GDSL hydrolase family protein [Planctomycetaceae bacterium]|nr:SGNH/GDSL hydrolase family protein [Planctomycetaceae bacterium]
MENEIKTQPENLTDPQSNSQQKISPKRSRLKKWTLNFIAVMFGFTVIFVFLGTLDILAQRELRKTGDALPKLFLYRGKIFSKYRQYSLNSHDPLMGPTRDMSNLFPNLVDDHLPYVVANYFKIFIRQSDIGKFETHSSMKPTIITPELLSKLERPFIICLGGSTTDPFLPILKKDRSIVANGTWSEELSRMMEKKKIKGTVFCGGMSGYTVSDDLLKLLRDVLEIAPDVVISYGGVNDLYVRKDFKIYNIASYKYHRRMYASSSGITSPIFPNIVSYITKREREREREREFTPMELYAGVKSNLSESEYMIRNWRIMNDICKLHNIKFYGVLQPCVGSTERTINDENLISAKWHKENLHNDDLWRPCFDILVKNYNHAKTETQKHSFLHDFSGIFDEKDLSVIYPFDKDWCHVSLAGNCIVAENMFRILFDKPDSVPVADSDKGETNLK